LKPLEAANLNTQIGKLSLIDGCQATGEMPNLDSMLESTRCKVRVTRNAQVIRLRHIREYSILQEKVSTAVERDLKIATRPFKT
jgi:hypothetical protein